MSTTTSPIQLPNIIGSDDNSSSNNNNAIVQPEHFNFNRTLSSSTSSSNASDLPFSVPVTPTQSKRSSRYPKKSSGRANIFGRSKKETDVNLDFQPVDDANTPPDGKRSCFQRVRTWINDKFFGKKELVRDPNQERMFVEAINDISTMDLDKVYVKLGTNYQGLSVHDAQERLATIGPNRIAMARPMQWYQLLAVSLTHPFNILLTIIAIVTVSTGDYETFTIVMAMVLLSSGLRFYEERKSTKAFKHLKSLISNNVVVVRRRYDADQYGEEMTVDIETVVPGDIVPLKAGNIFPGDVRLIECKSMNVSQSSLTGEFLPVEKTASYSLQTSSSIFDCPNMCLMSTNIVSGCGRGVVVNTGTSTYISSISEILTRTQKTNNSFEVGVKKVAYMIMGFGLVMVPIVITINGLTTKDWIGASLFGLSVAVGLTPEMLPMILNANLAKGASDMAKKKTIVKQLSSIQNIGAMNILCSDKTGTLTQDNVQLRSFVGLDNANRLQVLTYGFLNSINQKGLRNVLDESIIAESERLLAKDQLSAALGNYQYVEEFPFDFVRRRVSVILRDIHSDAGGEHILVSKGAVEEMVNICSHVVLDSGSAPVEMTEYIRESILALCRDHNDDGLRVLCVATKQLDPVSADDIKGQVFDMEQDECDLTFHGLLSFLDPPKDDCLASIQKFKESNVEVKVLTGDNLQVAKKICRDVGIDVTHVITGPELESVEPQEYDRLVQECTLFAKLTPIQKYEVVMALKRNNNTVGFLGDGINDALALRAADVGISVDSATGIAKEASDIILLEKSLEVINCAIKIGRITHANTIKYIKMAASSNFGNVFSVLVASAWLPFEPMQPLQLLAQNLLYDISQIAIPWDKVDPEFLRRPHPWSAKSLLRFMVCLGPTSSIFDIGIFAYMWFYLGWNTVAWKEYFQTGWFLEGMTTQLLIVHMIRTEKIPFIQRWSSWQLLVNTAWILALGIAIPYTPIGTKLLNMVNIPANYFPGFAGAIVGYFVITQLVKRLYIKVFGEWL
ncbi:hypothetical protein SAMD00019534_024170 [Acytostelium subglobosum LB1]|uniref:hypothetical protein n=1 Tax=Acytostelium subglobosum LB1 TaxID=1410327 RepID=UPI000644D264|nr:hypothetical protein SAMD00019534_024170 [Acytostelium subglobosum LB1]GAM19242.1 hypothetical protein SAMD00019534_024170 [Acytostelium subglobosum LB1]|eukprot:XP_012757169.1 hypothetical protein SAMD00019534_024170 [Acytostelium subglobosum LB1]